MADTLIFVMRWPTYLHMIEQELPAFETVPVDRTSASHSATAVAVAAKVEWTVCFVDAEFTVHLAPKPSYTKLLPTSWTDGINLFVAESSFNLDAMSEIWRTDFTCHIWCHFSFRSRPWVSRRTYSEAHELGYFWMSRRSSTRRVSELLDLIRGAAEATGDALEIGIDDLLQKAFASVRFRTRAIRFALCHGPSVRDHVQCFFIHTGSSPPRIAQSGVIPRDDGELCAENQRPQVSADFGNRKMSGHIQRSGERRILAGLASARGARLVDDRRLHSGRQAPRRPFRGANRRTLGDHVRVGLGCEPGLRARSGISLESATGAWHARW